MLALALSLMQAALSEPQPPPPFASSAGSSAVENRSREGVLDKLEPNGSSVTADDALIDGRRRPGVEKPLPEPVEQHNAGAIHAPPPEAFPTDQVPIPDRWRLIETLGVVKERWWDPYHQNTLKADRPIWGHDWFLALNGISDTVIEPRSFPQPVNRQANENGGALDVFGRDKSLVLAQTFIVGASLFKGSTAFKPPEIEYKVALAYNVNFVDVSERRVLDVRPTRPSHRYDSFLGV
jgi:hypothetical protein